MILTVLLLTINPYPKQGRHGISGYHFCFMVVHKNSKKKKSTLLSRLGWPETPVI
jgi:hypothetical protein